MNDTYLEFIKSVSGLK